MRRCERILDFYFRFCTAVKNSSLLTAVRNGFTYMVPLVMIGSFALVLLSFPIEAYHNLMNFLFDDEWKNILLYIRDGTFNSFSLIAVVCISYSYARENHEYRDYINPVIASVTSLASFVAFSGISSTGFSLSHFGVIGIFIALLVALISSELFKRLSAIKLFRVRMFSDGANPNFNNAVSLFLPAAITITLFAALNEGLWYFFDITHFQTFLSKCLPNLFSCIQSDFLRGILFILLIHLFWIFGIHGSNMLESVAQTLFVPMLRTNQDLITSGLAPTQIFTKTFFDAFVLMGGCGSMVCLVLAILIIGKSKSQRALAKLSLIPVLFNINELMVFGIPIVLNPIYAIPFLCVPLIMTTFSYFMMKFGMVPLTSQLVEWTTPVFLSGYVSTGSIMGSILQLMNLIIGTLIYIPFVKLSETAHQAQVAANLNQVCGAFAQSEARGVSSSLLSRYDNIGSIARLLAADLEYDLSHGGIALYYQPIVDDREQVVCLEALLRWKHRSYGFIYPPLIIALAEEAQIINKLGDFILDTACRDLAALKTSGYGNLTICVNVSPTQFEDHHFLMSLEQKIARYQLCPGSIELEVTERLALFGSEKISSLISSLNRMGVKLSMDDFGMGHGSLMYLKEYNFHTVKLDGALVREVLHNSNCGNIISSIVTLGKSLHYRVVAEYVEDTEQKELLRQLGCDLFQGYLFSKAVPLSEVADFIRRTKDLEPASAGNFCPPVTG